MNVCKFQLHLEPREPIILPPYKGATLRGGFGNAFKKVVCALKSKECSDCILKEQCVYSYIFETPPPAGTTVMRKYQSVPHPFIIEPPPEKRMGYKPGDDLAFGLILIGKAIDYLPYFIYTFDELGNMGIGKGRGKYTLKTVWQKKTNSSPIASCRAVSAEEHDIKIYTSETKKLTSFSPEDLVITSSPLTGSGGHVPEARQGSVRVPGITDEGAPSTITINPSPLTGEGMGEGDCNSLTLHFLTPARIYYNGNLTCDLEFHVLIRQLLRRISMLSYFHCGVDTSAWDFKGIIEKATGVTIKKRNLRWYYWQRYSTRQDQKIDMDGFVGDITYEGDISPFLSLIKAGEVLHVGKGTTFGLGKYEIGNQ